MKKGIEKLPSLQLGGKGHDDIGTDYSTRRVSKR